jgi:hypothetical protein
MSRITIIVESRHLLSALKTRVIGSQAYGSCAVVESRCNSDARLPRMTAMRIAIAEVENPHGRECKRAVVHRPSSTRDRRLRCGASHC